MSSDNNNKEGARLNYVDGYGYIELSKRMNYDLTSKPRKQTLPTMIKGRREQGSDSYKAM